MQNHQNDGACALLRARRALSANRPGSRARSAGISTIALAVVLAAAASLATPANAAHSKPNEVDCPKLTDEISAVGGDDNIIVEDGTCELQALSAADLDGNTPSDPGGGDPSGGGPGDGGPGGGDPGGGGPDDGGPGGGDPGGGGLDDGGPGGGDPGGGGGASGGSAAAGDHTKTGEDAADAGSGAGEGAIGAGEGAIGAGQGAIGAGQDAGGGGHPGKP